MILDQFGRPIEAVKTAPSRDRLGLSAIRDRWSTYPADGLTPSKLAAILKQADYGDCYQQAELFESMEEKDSRLAGLFATRKLAVSQLEWEIMPGDDSAKGAEIARFVEDRLGELRSWDDHVLDLLDAVGKGYAAMEIDWQLSEREWNVAGLNFIHPKNITWANHEYPKLITETNFSGEDIPPWKCLFHQYHARSGFAPRMGVLRTVAWIYLFKNYAMKDWVGFLETYALPLRVGKYPQGAADADKQALLAALAGLGADAAGIIPEGMAIEFIENNKTATSQVFDAALDYFDTQEAYAILGQTLTSSSGQDGSGSFALGQVHNDVRMDLVAADARALDRTLTDQLIRPLVLFNYGPEAPVPTIKHHYEPPEDLAATATLYVQLQSMGYPISAEHVEERFNVPRAKAGETPLSPATASPFGSGGTRPPAPPAMRPGSGDTPVSGQRLGDKSVAPTTGPGRAPDAAVVEDVQATALNGAQVQALVGVVQSVQSGAVTREAAIQIIALAFQLSVEQAGRILADTKPVATPAPGAAPPLAARDQTTAAGAADPAAAPIAASIEELQDKAAQEGANHIAGLVKQVEEIVANAADLDDLMTKLTAAGEDIDPGEFGEMVAQARALANLKGRLDVEGE